MRKCSQCGEVKNESEFYGSKSKGKYYLRYECKSCFNKICNENGREIKRKRIHEAREYALNKLGGKCFNCGSTDKSILHFHHINPETKISNLTILYNCTGANARKRVDNELRKCIILCKFCHSRHHNGLRKKVKSL